MNQIDLINDENLINQSPLRTSTTPTKQTPSKKNVVVQQMLTFARLRPCIGEEGKDLPVSVRVIDNTTLSIFNSMDPFSERHFSFSQVLGPQNSQSETFAVTTLPLLESFLTGPNGNQSFLFTYGITGSGKTYTISGSYDNPGILPRTLSFVCQKIDEVSKVIKKRIKFLSNLHFKIFQ